MSTATEVLHDLGMPMMKIEPSNECKTPSSKENKIPAVVSCPPAPKKPKMTVSCKRNLSAQFQFFDRVNREEVDAFFKAAFDDPVSKRSLFVMNWNYKPKIYHWDSNKSVNIQTA
ncbi:cyclin-dependent protein kinase inhibitor SMR1-like [Hibiscus syriacus]|uniref:cyclin-dependent protein kinase inhibitor SMR1-like n=1 Tax=Hibiscus syriacus TaxID=106335 RepID=UPI001922B9C0|nr:cyclin-dependent protein kinase inhibitor SMR1-like [Hibiscus syriacus]